MVYSSALLIEKLKIIGGKWAIKITSQNMDIFLLGYFLSNMLLHSMYNMDVISY